MTVAQKGIQNHGSSARTSSRTRPRRKFDSWHFLQPDGRLPGFAQRRLDDLISRKKDTGLSAEEERELGEALDYIDAKSALLLQARASATRGKSGSASRRVSGK